MSNIAAESLLLSCFMQFPDAFFGVADFMSEEDFEHEGHQMVFLTLKSLYLEKEADKLSKVKLIAEAKSLGFETFKSATQNYGVLDQVLGNIVQAGDVNGYFQDVKRLSIIRTYEVEFSRQRKYLRDTRDNLATIIGNVEESVFNVPDLVDHGQHGIISLAKDAEQIISELAETPGQVGLDVGLPVWQNRIGQIRNGGVTFVVATAKCVTGDTRIYDPVSGRYNVIEDIVHGTIHQLKVAAKDDFQKIVQSDITNRFQRGNKTVYEVKTNLGHTFQCTSNHLLYGDFGWQKLSSLKPNDYIAVAKKLPEPSNPDNIFSNNECYLIGLMFGDGDNGKTPSFTNYDDDVVDAFFDTTLSLGITTSVCSREHKFLILENGRRLLQDAGIYRTLSKNKTISNNIYSLSNERLANFLAGLWDTDGSCLFKDDHSFIETSITLASRQAISSIHELLLRFGIVSTFKYKKATCNNKKFDSWRIMLISRDSIRCFHKHIAPYMRHRNKRANLNHFLDSKKEVFEKSNLDTFNRSMVSDIWDRDSTVSYNSLNLRSLRTRSCRRVGRGVMFQYADLINSHELRALSESDIFMDKIISIHEAGCMPVYDISVNETANFVGNNIILHNCGKSQLGLGRGIYVAHKLNLPVLLCDSELSKNEQVIRLVGMMAHIPYHVLETGYWKLSPDELKAEGIPDSELAMYAEYKQRMMDRQFWDRVSKLPIDYISVSGLPMEEVLPRLRRWVMTRVKPHLDAKFPECLIIYDYIKLTSFDELRGGKLGEYQVHGFNMMALHEFCKRYNVPVLAFGQTNRELDTDFNCIAGAKRIMDNVTSATLLKAKTEEEIGFDPTGNHFLRVFGARFGPATPSGHININFDKSNGSIEELGYASMDFAAKRAERLEAWKKSKGKRKKDDDWDDDDD